ncbi:hypothetical protein RV15_GL001174 [Enterococcus silesiacus]|uniref:Uncharacterized protein n=1 Tax=Enterococcus silesiacus TaxID=332949 RepID=A0AA91GDG5_9ENTE|nr:hypothetical protein RV15_GL001174 [Enterococcus silesiacus]
MEQIMVEVPEKILKTTKVLKKGKGEGTYDEKGNKFRD